MFSKDDITLADIKSTPEPAITYMKSNKVYKDNFANYSPNPEVLSKIKAWTVEHNENITVIAFGASWCGDCKKNMPELAKIDEIMDHKQFASKILANIKVIPPYERKEGELIWKSPPSPPETLDKKFDMFHIPAMFIFNKAGQCLGKIDENPEHKDTLEEEILYYLN